jgi:hypothetical protein
VNRKAAQKREQDKAEAIMRRLDGEPPAGADADPALDAEYEALRGIHADLIALGGRAAASPGPDMAEAVRAGVKALNAGERRLRPVMAPDPETLMAWVENDLPPERRAYIENLFTAEPVLREEAEALRVIHRELEAAGAAAGASAPEADMAEGIMAIVRGDAPVTPQPVTPFRTRPKPALEPRREPAPVLTFRFRFRHAVALATAAGLLIALGFMLRPLILSLTAPETDRLAQPVKTPAPETPEAAKPGESETAPLFRALEPIENPLLLAEEHTKKPRKTEARPEADRKISLQEVLNQRRAALQGDTAALLRLNQLASLSHADARELLNAGELSDEALLGLARYLEDEVAAQVLEAVAARRPDDPYPRYALAMRSRDNADYGKKIANWAEKDEENALPFYFEAHHLFVEKDPEKALSALDTAAARESGSSYALPAAQQQEEALTESGMAPDVARLLAATTAGSQEYADLTRLSRELISYGKYYEAQGDFTTAEQIYQSVMQMGMQVDYGADMANERLAGIDTQIEAVNAMQTMFDMLNTETESHPELTGAYAALYDSLSHFSDILTQVNALFMRDDPGTISEVTDTILETGDLALFQEQS